MTFFGNKKLEEEIAQKDLLINKLMADIKSLKSKHKEELRSLMRDLTKSTEELNVLKKEHKEYIEKVEAIVNLDVLSGSKNKRYFYDIVESMISLSKRHKTSLSIALLYIDKFNTMDVENPLANEILQIMVHEVSMQIRESDVFVRLEGAKFVILFPHASLDQACKVAEKLRKKIENCQTADEIKFTISLGLAEFSENENVNSVLKRAQEKLEKLQGPIGNRVCS